MISDRRKRWELSLAEFNSNAYLNRSRLGSRSEITVLPFYFDTFTVERRVKNQHVDDRTLPVAGLSRFAMGNLQNVAFIKT